jgi:lipopolysaccharide transport system ATP-binding protein
MLGENLLDGASPPLTSPPTRADLPGDGAAPTRSEVVIDAKGAGKAYAIFRRPEDRLKQMLVRGRRRYYDEFWALKDVDLEVRRGEAVALIGRNGSGKSTLLQLICGTLTPTTGRIDVNGRVGALLELGAGFNPAFTGRENVYLSASIHGLSRQETDDRFGAIADFAGIGDFIDQPVKLYSSGMYARLAFAVMAHVDPDILIVDEILAVGDAAFGQKCMRFIRRFLERGTLLFVSHDVATVLSLCSKAVWLDTGTVRQIGPAKEVCQAYTAALEGEKESERAFAIGGTRKVAVEAAAPPLPDSAPEHPPEPRPSLEADLPRDVREDTLRKLGALPQVEFFQFDPDAPWFGRQGATITRVHLSDPGGQAVSSFSGGEEVVLHVEAEAHQDLPRPILGFIVRDRLGQVIFSDNTHLSYADRPVGAASGQRLRASFHFRFPYLASGDYAVSVSIAEGTQLDHVQHHWVDEAVFFRVAAPKLAKGLVGIPMRAIELHVAS